MRRENDGREERRDEKEKEASEMSKDTQAADTSAPAVRRHRQGWLAIGPGFRVWQEDEASARAWFDTLMNAISVTPGLTDAPTPEPERTAQAR
jgi:hypothetical protein